MMTKAFPKAMLSRLGDVATIESAEEVATIESGESVEESTEKRDTYIVDVVAFEAPRGRNIFVKRYIPAPHTGSISGQKITTPRQSDVESSRNDCELMFPIKRFVLSTTC